MANSSQYKKKKNRKGLKSTIFLKKNHKGLSTVVTTVLLIALGVIAATTVWIFVNNFIKNQTQSSSCYGNYDKIMINGEYTCFNKTAPANYNLRFSLSVADVDIGRAVVSVYSASAIKSYEITNVSQTVAGLTMYPSGSANIILPGKNSGLTYQAIGFPEKIDSVKVAAYIGGTLCDTSDTVSEIESCDLFF